MSRSEFTKDDRGLMNGELEPQMYVDRAEERFGLTEYAEIINGRLAMVGIVALFVLEAITGKGILALLGF